MVKKDKIGVAKQPRKKLSERYSRNTPIKEQLKGRKCDHRGLVTTNTNRKGQKFKECSGCGAFLGWS